MINIYIFQKVLHTNFWLRHCGLGRKIMGEDEKKGSLLCFFSLKLTLGYWAPHCPLTTSLPDGLPPKAVQIDEKLTLCETLFLFETKLFHTK